jgi:uncharacterized membrane protein YtjA (UPF0391 family)
MLAYTITFMLIAIAAAIMGFGVVAGAASSVAKICFFLFLVLCITSLLRVKTT